MEDTEGNQPNGGEGFSALEAENTQHEDTPHPVIEACEADRPSTRDRMLTAGIAAIIADLEPVYRAAAGNPALQAFARALEQSLRNIFVLLLDGPPEA